MMFINTNLVLTNNNMMFTYVVNKYYADWMYIILKDQFDQITWTFSPSHAGIVGNERVDVLAGAAVIDKIFTLDLTLLKIAI